MRRFTRNILIAVGLVLVTLALFAHRRADLEVFSSTPWRHGDKVTEDAAGSSRGSQHNSALKGMKTTFLQTPPASTNAPLSPSLPSSPPQPPQTPPNPPSPNPPSPNPPSPNHPSPNPPSPPNLQSPPQRPQPPSPPKPPTPPVVPLLPTAPGFPEDSIPSILPAAVEGPKGLGDDDVPQLLPLPSDNTQSSPTPFHAEFPFQKDLPINLPITNLKLFSNYPPHNYKTEGQNSYAYATFMATRNPSVKDPYYLAIHSLIHRILWSDRSSSKYPFIVFVADFVTQEQRDLLSGAGAVVRELQPLEWNPNVEGVQTRWKDLFAKLNMWNETDFDRILFLDADAFPLTKIDDMFDNAPLQECKSNKLRPDDKLQDGTPVCEPYVFAGVPHQPFNATDPNINVGSMVFSPSKRMHRRLLQNYVKTDRYDCLMAEQAFLNWQFHPEGAFPPTKLERQWGGFMPSESDEGKLKVVHEKLWSQTETSWMKKEWNWGWGELEVFYGSEGFAKLRGVDRGNDGLGR